MSAKEKISLEENDLKTSPNFIDETKQEKRNKTKRIWWRILSLSIPIVGISWLIISTIFYIISVGTWEWSELMITIKESINWILWILCILSFFSLYDESLYFVNQVQNQTEFYMMAMK